MAHDTVLVATTSQAGLHPIGTGGQPVTQAFDQIDRYLRQNLSEDHARLFAEPNLNPARGTVDWSPGCATTSNGWPRDYRGRAAAATG